MKRIDSLTGEQKAQLPEWCDKWVKIGLCTDPADRPTFEGSVVDCYRAAKLDPPKRVAWVQNPLETIFAGPIAARLIADEAQSVGDAVDEAMRRAKRAAAGGTLDDADRAAIKATWARYIGGQFWVGGWYWGSPAYVSFFREVCGLELPKDIAWRALAYEATARSACWWWPHKDFVLVCDRPKVVARDAQGRLHREDGPAIELRDGWGVHAWHGVRVPADVIERPGGITVKRIQSESNAEARRVLIERFGLGRYVQESGAKVVDRDRAMKLYRTDVPNDEPIVALEVTNSTPEPDGTRKTYLLRVPPTVRKAQEAVAWTFGLAAGEYAPDVET